MTVKELLSLFSFMPDVIITTQGEILYNGEVKGSYINRIVYKVFKEGDRIRVYVH